MLADGGNLNVQRPQRSVWVILLVAVVAVLLWIGENKPWKRCKLDRSAQDCRSRLCCCCVGTIKGLRHESLAALPRDSCMVTRQARRDDTTQRELVDE